ncbi:cardiolipin synthase [Pseudodesulfovibrio sediminis]|uniref:Cardiolipin synthase n=1 Tax=Pseudodesulfovibrio sediminis TaxID=2810563 RepID=A0ABN6ELQ5_9BACT|nr:cardiolipin synthase [Pseudodesulfovibrio sediminis]BCS86986.1 cardiolipin synthase [Pseudodesulfovibrio sediminis]
MELSLILGIISLLYTTIELTAIFTVFIAVNDTRTPQGAIAWAISLITFPIVALPLYWIFGRPKFHGYVDAIRAGREEFRALIGNEHAIPGVRDLAERRSPHAPRTVFETLARIPFLGGNDLELLIDGPATFEAICAAIERAKRYVLIQFFIVHDDTLGKRIQQLLIRKASEGIRIHFLYDEIGCHNTPNSYWETLRASGVDIRPFHTTKGPGNRFQLNFRNHRKIVVVDGKTAFVGGHNIGDEYMGKSKNFSGWRDTHMRITGPAVLGVQVSFGKDWYWATQDILDLDLSMPAHTGNAEVLALGTGPEDRLEACSLMFIRSIEAAQERFWIASPYFVPDSAVMKAIQLAALRGVDVRIMLPEKADHRLVYLAGFACLKELDLPGVRVYRYTEGFLHQKTFLVDDILAGVGTANLDNRSFRLNFEITMLIEDEPFCQKIEAMFLDDFKRCIETGPDEFDHKNFLYKTAIKFARLFSPIL